jgi:hypothetical protein
MVGGILPFDHKDVVVVTRILAAQQNRLDLGLKHLPQPAQQPDDKARQPRPL